MTLPSDDERTDRMEAAVDVDRTDEPGGPDRFPGGADPLFSPEAHARMGKVAHYLFGGLIFAIVMAVLDQLFGDPFEWGLLGVRTVTYAIILAAFDAIGWGYRAWRKQRQRG